MKEFDKDFENNPNGCSDDIKDRIREEEPNVYAFENVQKGEKKYEQGSWSEGGANETKKEAAGAEEKADAKKEKDFDKQGQTDGAVNAQYSSYYTPPYYVPNFVVSDGTVPNSAQKKNKSSKKAWVIVAIVAGILVFCLVAGIGLFAVSNFIKAALYGGGGSYIGDDMEIVQNSPGVEITKNTDTSYEPKTLPEVVSKVANSVVEISVSEKAGFFNQYVTAGAGSGVIITQSETAGYLLTNYHVVYNTDDSVIDNISVMLTNGEKYEAALIGSDGALDLALLRIAKKSNETFTVAQFGDSSKLVVGQDIIAIGNPLGSLGGTVTDGIISALDRRIMIDGVEMVLLQHNAAINPGNSGGALFDMMGNLVGIVNAKTSEIGIEGLGFAIPSNIALTFINRIMVVEPSIGISVKYGRLAGEPGLWVTVASGEFQKYDKIIQVNGENIESAADYYAKIGDLRKGDSVTISVMRSGNKMDITVTIK